MSGEGIQDRAGGITTSDGPHVNGTSGSNGVGHPAEHTAATNEQDPDALETQEWLDSLEAVLYYAGKDRAQYLLSQIGNKASRSGVPLPVRRDDARTSTPSPPRTSRPSPATARSSAASRASSAGTPSPWSSPRTRPRRASAGTSAPSPRPRLSTRPASTTSSAASTTPAAAISIYFQGHASPGMYSRAFLEGRLTEQLLKNFRRELAPGGGLSSSYPHPWLMPQFWQFPTVSMGLGPIMGIYQARFNRYLENRGLKPATDQKVWCFLGDGEMDEPESLGAITLASREHLDNLIFVVNCNLQRLDGPVRGNGKIIQELEAAFRGAGLELHQGPLGQRVGSAPRRRPHRPCSSSAWAKSSTASTRSTSSATGRTSARTSSASTPSCSNSSRT